MIILVFKNKVRLFLRVKHNHKDAILYVRKIDFDTFNKIKENNQNDPYLHCNNKREQKQIKNLKERMEVDLRNVEIKYDKKERKEKIKFKSKKEKILKRTNTLDEKEYLY